MFALHVEANVISQVIMIRQSMYWKLSTTVGERTERPS